MVMTIILEMIFLLGIVPTTAPQEVGGKQSLSNCQSSHFKQINFIRDLYSALKSEYM